MKKASIRIISTFLVTLLITLSFSGCELLDAIGDSIVDSMYGDALSGGTDEGDDGFSVEEAINQITTTKMSAAVTLTVNHYNRGTFGLITDSATMLGSGSVIMKASDITGTKLYVLTNAHCVESLPDRQYKTISMTDYRGNEYTNGTVMPGSLSEKYDLAVVIFSCTESPTTTVTLAKEDPERGDTVFAIGSPHAQVNSITVGKISAYYQGELVEVETLYHTAPLGSGGSGGALLNTKLELCGVNFAADITETDFGNGSSIPIEAVREYLATLQIFNELLK